MGITEGRLMDPAAPGLGGHLPQRKVLEKAWHRAAVRSNHGDWSDPFYQPFSPFTMG
jgi:hypothetical protein